MPTLLSPTQIQGIQQLIETNYSKLQGGVNHTDTSNIYYEIIQQKLLVNTNHHLYLDAKSFIHHYILSAYEQDFGYDVISVNKILKIINYTNNFQKEALLKYSIHQLKLYGQDEVVGDFEKVLRKTQISISAKKIVSDRSLKEIGKIILILSTQGYGSIFTALAIVVVVVTSVSYPALSKNVELFEFTYVKYTGLRLVDHIFSVVLLLLGADDRVKMYALNLKGGIILIVSKLFYLIFIASIVLKQFEKKIES